MKFKIKSAAGILAVALLFCLAAAAVPAQDKMSAKDISKEKRDGRKKVDKAAAVFREVMNTPDKAIPRELLDKAEAIGIFPDVVKAGFIVGGRGGDGVVTRRTAHGWSAPVFYNLGGASFGAQIGVKKTDYVMLFMNEGALKQLADDKLEFSGDVSFAAGPVGRTLAAGTDATLKAGILVYSRSEGAFIGASIGGAVITADNHANNAFYNMDGHAVLDDPAIPTPTGLDALNSALMGYSKK